MGYVIGLLVPVVWAWASYSVGMMAQRKGRSFSVFSFISVLASPLVGWVLVSLVSSDLPNVGDAVATLQRTELAYGNELPRSYVTKVLATDVKLQTPVVQVDVDGRGVWIARSNVRKV